MIGEKIKMTEEKITISEIDSTIEAWQQEVEGLRDSFFDLIKKKAPLGIIKKEEGIQLHLPKFEYVIDKVCEGLAQYSLQTLSLVASFGGKKEGHKYARKIVDQLNYLAAYMKEGTQMVVDSSKVLADNDPKALLKILKDLSNDERLVIDD